MADLQPCHFLNLPVELRVQIYSYTIPHGTYTITAEPSEHPSRHERHNSTDYMIRGLLGAHNVVARCGYNEDLLRPHEDQCSQNPPRDTPSPEEMQMMLEIMQESQQADTENSMGHLAGLLWSQYMSSRPTACTRPATMEPRPVRDASGTCEFIAACEDKISRQVEDRSTDLYDNILALHQTCRTIHEDLIEHFPKSSSSTHERVASNLNRAQELPTRCLDLYLSFPAGVCILAHRFPHLLRLAKNVRIAGIQQLYDQAQSPDIQKALEDQCKAIEIIARTLMGKKAVENFEASQRRHHPTVETSSAVYSLTDTIHLPSPPLTPTMVSVPSIRSLKAQPSPDSPTFHIRIFHPPLTDPPSSINNFIDVYALVWRSPYTASLKAMHNVYGGMIEQSVWRGREGTGMELKVNLDVGQIRDFGKRVISVRHPRCERGWDGVAWLLQGWDELDG